MIASGAIEVCAAVIAAATGIALLTRAMARGSGWLLLAAGATIPLLLADESAPAVLFTLSLILGGLPMVLAAAAGIAWPVAPPGRALAFVIATSFGAAGIIGGLAPALLFDAADAGCNACPANLVHLYSATPAANGLLRTAEVLALVWGPALIALAAHRWRRSSPLERRYSWPQLAGGGGIAVLSTISAGHGLGLPLGELDPLEDRIRILQAALVIVIAAGAVARIRLARTAGARMARIVLAAIPEPSAVIGSLRRAVADPGLEVAFIRADGRPIDLDGQQAEPAAARAVLRLSRDQLSFAEIRYDHRLDESPDLVRTSATAAGLALEYLAAQARLRAELRDVAQARLRLVTAASTERHRLERNLHDGAQQQLIALGMMLTATSATTGVPLTAEHAQVDAALGELRAVARGLFPASLQEAGIRAALRELGDHTRCPLVVSGAIEGTVPPDGEMAIYQLVSEVSRLHPPGSALRVVLDGGAGRPGLINVTTAVPHDELRNRIVHAEDRFVAAGGELTLRADGDAVVIEGVVPCGS